MGISQNDFEALLKDTGLTPQQKVSKFTNYYVTAGSMDSGDKTVDIIFSTAMMIAEPVSPLEEKGVIEVKETAPNHDKVTFTVVTGSSFTWSTEDVRGSEMVAGGSYQQINAPTFTQAQPTTKKATIAIHDDINLVNPTDFKTYAIIAGDAAKKKKILDGITELSTASNYTASTSIRNGNGYTTYSTSSGAVASDDTCTPNDLTSAKEDLKSDSTNPLVADICLINTNQLNQLQNHGDFSRGQTTNSNWMRAKFDADGNLVSFDGMEIVELLTRDYAARTTAPFDTNNGHFVIIGARKFMLGRGQNSRKNTVEDFRDPKDGFTQRTLRINYDYVIKYPDGIRLIACTD